NGAGPTPRKLPFEKISNRSQEPPAGNGAAQMKVNRDTRILGCAKRQVNEAKQATGLTKSMCWDLARACRLGEHAQAQNAHQGFLDMQKLTLALVFFFCAVTQGFLQQDQIAPEFKLGEDQAAQSFQRFLLIRRQIAGSAINHANRAEGIAILVDEGSAGVEAYVWIGNNKRVVAKTLIR